ncbi:GAF and ANTAR domain-containing protein [Kribbella qitaiheensis]|uniref:GAF and ANTAR domain-containing protein n=1 Tax=Kribbella qitaiheensis TaxID=1544730 RepID=A0A7G6X2K5_9ACTN|nr:GAF and ANTAR domain-containing protein [Kribbella qitaiheensis]QNE20470.1 GAF and ANTAR domain-containing protein [Kribbella qitaiheensis]
MGSQPAAQHAALSDFPRTYPRDDIPPDASGPGSVKDEFAQELARMAQVLHERPDVEQTAERFLEYVLAGLATSHASVVLTHRGGRLESAVSTDALVEEADRLQVELGEGPTYDAVQEERSMLSGDAWADERWPQWSAGMATVGLRSVLSVRLRTPSSTVGVLNLFDPAVDRFSESDDLTAQVFADHAAVAVANARSESSLWQAIESRRLIGQAQGILMERFDLSEEQAFAVLRRYSQDSNVRLREIAKRLIQTRKLS